MPSAQAICEDFIDTCGVSHGWPNASVLLCGATCASIRVHNAIVDLFLRCLTGCPSSYLVVERIFAGVSKLRISDNIP